MTTLTCDHCPAEIDVALDPRCVVYDPSGATDVICEGCRERAWEKWVEEDQEIWPSDKAYRIKRGWRA